MLGLYAMGGPAGTVGYASGYFMASADAVDITVRGIGGYGSRPEAAKDPIVVAAQIVLALQTIVSRENSPLDPAVVSVGSIHVGVFDPAQFAKSQKTGTQLPSNHSSLFAPPHPEPTLKTAVQAMTTAVLDLMKK